MKIVIKTAGKEFRGELNDSKTSTLIADALPINGRVSRWGLEIYFAIPVETGREAEARSQVSVGELGYWPDGSAFCIFFGKTPVSQGDAPVAASPVNPIGKLDEPIDVAALDAVPNGAEIVIESAQ